jgi:hypothetical protein
MFTKQFREISKDDVSTAGGKGASLGELTNYNTMITLTKNFTRECSLFYPVRKPRPLGRGWI